MSDRATYDVAVIGGGIVGLAVARELVRRGRRRLVVLEAEDRLATQQSGHNSGVIHSGLYYRPGSHKARNCTAGRESMVRFCRENGIPHETCGKLVVATSADEVGPLRELERRGLANGLEGIETLDAAEIPRREPHVRGAAALWVPQTGIVDFAEVAAAIAREARDGGAEIRTGARVRSVLRRSGGFVLQYDGGEAEAAYLINCGGLYSDRIARACGLDPDVRIVPFRGEYFKLVPHRVHLVRNLVYPVPDPRFPFLGVHFTRMLRGGVEVGPNAVPALSRQGYERLSFSARDVLELATEPRVWRMAAKYWRTGVAEVYRSASRSALGRALRRMVPDLEPADLQRAGSGVRAQAVARDGSLVDDFRILEAERMLHVLNAPSPAATASLSIARTLADRVAV